MVALFREAPPHGGLVHLREANHGPRFQAILDEVMPMWREHRDALNDAPLAHVDWDY